MVQLQHQWSKPIVLGSLASLGPFRKSVRSFLLQLHYVYENRLFFLSFDQRTYQGRLKIEVEMQMHLSFIKTFIRALQNCKTLLLFTLIFFVLENMIIIKYDLC